MRSIEKVCMAVTLAAALGLKGQVIKPNSQSIKQRFGAIGSSSVRFFSSAIDGSMKDCTVVIARDKAKPKAAEDSLRMVVYLSCWGPN
ncbi:hypothetical protein QJS04_geneDACA021985 [Acorus gramineus]|uniref:Uncharacterized protein n=1 Tax=Acorus gramineus TaxID=55184 RepID=A0AAV9A9F6_ACOGR|nr:hypothetical protein QJS04_geneDACA021985 [Acorus gramineus]